MGEPRRRQRDCPIVAALRQPIDHRPARISEAEELRDFVVRLPRRIVTRAAEQLVGADAFDEIEARVAAGHHENNRRKRQLAVLQHERFDVSGQMVHRNEGNTGRGRRRLRE